MMRLIGIWVVALGLAFGANAAEARAMATAQAGSQPPKQQEEFVPIDQLPPEEQLPAAPMVVAAYVFVWVAFIGYVFTLIKRVRKVEGDLRRLEQGGR